MAAQYQITGDSAASIVTSIEEGVRQGALRPGDSLPTVRGLASALGVAANTAAAAYQQLRARGMIETAGRHGTRVRPVTPLGRTSRGLPVPVGVADLSSGAPTLLPALGPVLATVAREVGDQPSYGAAGPLPELIAAARERLPELPAGCAITVVSGALDGLDRLLSTQLRPGDPVGVEDPGWAALLDLIAALGLTPVPMPVDEDGPTEEGLRRALGAGVKAIIVTTRAQNPTGAAVTRARARALRHLLDGEDVLVIEDDHAAELAGVELHPLAGATARWAFLRSASKPYGPDLRIAALAGDDVTISRVAGRLALGAGWVSTVLQRVLLHLWAEADVTAAREAYDLRRRAVLAALAERGVPATGRTGINIWVSVADETRVVATLRDAGYAVAPGSLFRIAAAPGIRVTVAGLHPVDITNFVDALVGAVQAGERAGRF
ncbi:DNA-binding transcriptional MocR family regulator [Allocatelliglobosispora scoriae]|uniref:DNA-binding transcriptional MocR family regulator n=1 Tax=Allocatelliglobosispora scoriae TaxID=643052 RepID=A0A841BVX9_9ACTN|nr:aminotransferase class I/II-fold pyridoxal phosphate-dependent enzyme [Allocatelliglobosispora scoriae]MBB5872324.1 DNA-binding transcriptional MocR family regulator [Allocatelliglobosispora scoriae]